MKDLERFKELYFSCLIVFAQTEDWQDVWIDGKLVLSGHSHHPLEVLEKLEKHYMLNGYEELTIGQVYFELEEERECWQLPEQWEEYEKLFKRFT